MVEHRPLDTPSQQVILTQTPDSEPISPSGNSSRPEGKTILIPKRITEATTLTQQSLLYLSDSSQIYTLYTQGYYEYMYTNHFPHTNCSCHFHREINTWLNS